MAEAIQKNRDKDYVVEKEIFILGLNRSGQHGVMAWLTGMMNDVIIKNNMLKRQLYESAFSPYFNYYQDKMRGGGVLMTLAPMRKRTVEALILGGENHLPHDFSIWYKNRFYSYRERKIKKMFNKTGVKNLSKERYFITILRSPHNQASSALRWKTFTYHRINDPRFFIPSWKAFAKEQLGITNYLSDLPGTYVPIVYDFWFSDETYRRSIAKKIGLEYNEDQLNRVMRCGRGSSFIKQRANGAAQDMPTDKRWKYFFDKKPQFKKRYMMSLNDEELLDLSAKIFGPMPQEINDEICNGIISS